MDAQHLNVSPDGCVILLAGGGAITVRPTDPGTIAVCGQPATYAEARAFAKLIGEQCRNAEMADGAEVDHGLTPREAEVLRYLASGFSNKDTARRIGVSVRTVESHRLNLRRKVGGHGERKDLAAFARQIGLVPVEAA